MIEFKPKDILAIIVAIGCLYLIYSGIDGQVKAFLGFIIGYYFRSINNFVQRKITELRKA